MSRSIELPDSTYERLESLASARGTTPAGWVAEQVANGSLRQTGVSPERAGDDTVPSPNPGVSRDQPPRTLADLFEGLIGVVSLDRTDLSERHGELFSEGMQEKRHQGHL